MKKSNHYLIYYLLLICLFSFSSSVMSQRKMEILDRGVVAMPKSSSKIYISWRHLATDPDNIAYNIYYKTSGAGSLTKLNLTPIVNSTNFTANLSTSSNDYTFVVKSIMNGIEKDEPGEFTVPRNTPTSRIVRDFDFEPIPEETETIKMWMKFCWPADLNGDGKYDYIIDRQYYGNVDSEDEAGEISSDYLSPKIEAYSSEGVFLWRIDMGYNVNVNNGHADMVTAYDMNGDGKAEVLMAVSEGTTFADGTVITGENGLVTDYRKLQGSAPQWVAIVDGQTGKLIDKTPLPMFDQLITTRVDKWKHMCGHFIIAYLDGINPSLIYQYKNRKADNEFQGAYTAWHFRGGKLIEDWSVRFQKEETEYESHQVRAADIDGDGKDEFVEISYAIDDDGTYIYYAPNVKHGDRHCLADIDPDRPGLEHFFIQQTNIMGMGVFDAATGEILKGLYMSAVADVGRGACGAFDTRLRGLQFYSTMGSYAMYDYKGKLTGSKGTFPGEVLWWGGDLSRREVNSAGGDKNPIINKFDISSNSLVREYPQLYNENNGNGNYYFNARNGGRAAFWGDILGDWREELVYCRTNGTGFVVLSTWDETSIRQYCLMQNPSYRIQTTARGYYQTADVDFYMAKDMPNAPIAPIQTADEYLTDGNILTAAYANGKSVMLDIRNTNTNIILNENISPTRLWLMNPKGKDYIFTGTGKLTGSADVVKSLQGDVVFNGNYDYTGKTRISEGRLFVNGTLLSPVQLDARGVIGGAAILNGGIVLETGLNIEGARIEPGSGVDLGDLTIVGNLNLPGRNNLAFDVDQTNPKTNDVINVQGDFIISGENNSIIIKPNTDIQAGTLTLITFSGTTNAIASNFSIKGLEGVPYTLIIEPGAIKLEINNPRTTNARIEWTGANSDIWDFQTNNFLNGITEDLFTPNDIVVFNDNASNKEITINETMPIGGIVFNNNSDYIIKGDGVISGNGGLVKTGTGMVSLLTQENSFTGAVDFSEGILEVSSLKDGGQPSSIGSSSNDAANWVMRNATLQTTDQMATDRNMTVFGKLTVSNPLKTNSVVLKGNIIGEDISLEQTGLGSLNLQGINTFKSVTVKSGTLALGNLQANSKSLGDGTVTIEDAVLQMRDNNSSGSIVAFTNTINVPSGKSAKWNLPMRWLFTNKLTGSGTIEINVPYTRSDFNGDWSEFSGVINFTGKEIRLNTAEARNIPDAEINLGSGTSLYVASNGGNQSSYSYAITFGALSGDGNISGRNNYKIGSKNTNTTYNGIMGSGAGSITKVGLGSLTLTGDNLYTAGTKVEEGKLVIANTTGSATGTGPVNVYNSGTLLGTGTISGSTTINEGGILMPGLDESSIGTLTFNSDLILNAGSTTTIKTSSDGNDLLNIASNLILNGTLNMENLNGVYGLGDTYTIFSVSGNVEGEFNSIFPEKPGEDLLWDISRINEGVISVSRKLAQTITFDMPSNKLVNDSDFTLEATASSGLPITYSSSDTDVATIIDNNKVHIIGAGVTTITARQEGNSEYQTATASLELTVSKVSQEILFDAIPDKMVHESDFDLNAIATSGLEIIYTSSNTNVATILNNKIHITGIGTTEITAIQAGNDIYEEVSVVREFNVVASEINISEFKINGQDWDMDKKFIVPMNYFGNNLNVTIDAGSYVTIDKGNSFDIDVENPSVQTITFTITADWGEIKKYSFQVEKRFNFLDLITIKWNNTLVVNNNKNKNGGYKFKGYNWYKNGVQVQVGNKQHYRETKEENANYYVELITNEGEILSTWDHNLSLTASKVKVYPNPVSRSEVAYVDVSSLIDDEFHKNAKVEVYNIYGYLIQRINLTNSITPLDLKSVPVGTYLIKIISDDTSQEFKLIVK